MRYRIVQTETGHSFGLYEGETGADAIGAMLADAGHDGEADPGIVARAVPSYCVQNGGDCEACSLVSYGRDCANVRLTENGQS